MIAPRLVAAVVVEALAALAGFVVAMTLPIQARADTAPTIQAEPWRLVVRTPADEVRPHGFAKLIGIEELDKAMIWGSPADKSDKDWCAIALDLGKGQWQPIVPAGKEGWLAARPKMRLGMRWGAGIALDSPDGLLQPVPMCYFNQAVWVPSMKKVLFFVGGKHLAFDPAAGTWEELKPKVAPPHVVWSAMCHDPVNDEVVLFGGGADCDENTPGTWLLDCKAATWRKLDQPLAEQPPARCNAPLAYDSKNKLIAVFGGNAQDHFLADTWVYDCVKRRWRELKTNVQPYPRNAPAMCFAAKAGLFVMGGAPAGKASRAIAEETWTLDAAAGTWTCIPGTFPAGTWNSAIYDAKRDRVLVYQTAASGKESAIWQLSLLEPIRSVANLSASAATAPDKPVTLYHGPEWFTDGIEPADPKAAAEFLAGLKPNEWTPAKPPGGKNGEMRTWGSANVDTDASEVLYWGGGHCGYCGTDVHHFSLKTLRWTGSFAPEFPPSPYNAFYGDESSFLIACRSFHGRPWVQHGRTSYAYDPTTKLVAFTQSISEAPTRGWTYIYDPAKRDFVDRFAQPFVAGWSNRSTKSRLAGS